MRAPQYAQGFVCILAPEQVAVHLAHMPVPQSSLLWVFKTGIWGSKLAQSVSEFANLSGVPEAYLRTYVARAVLCPKRAQLLVTGWASLRCN